MAKKRKVVRTKRIYRGPSKRTRSVLRALLFLLILLVLVVAGYFLSMGFSALFANGDNAPESSAESALLPESSEEGTPESSEESSKEESSEPPVEEPDIKGLTVSFDAARLSGDALDNYLNERKAEGYTHIFVELKNVNGYVLFKTDAPQAVGFGSVTNGAFDAEVFTAAVKKAGMIPAAKITTLRDPLVAHVRNGNSFAHSSSREVNWLDYSPELGGKPWLNPYMEKARGYIVELTEDAIDKGFEMIVLSDVNFPTRTSPSMDTILKEPSRNAILGQLLNEVQAAAGDVPVLNSVNLAEQFMLTDKVPFADMLEIGYTTNAPYISLAAIEWNKPYLAEKFSVENDGVAIARAMLTRFKSQTALTEMFVPMIAQSDADVLLPILKELGIEEYIVL